MCLPGCLLPSLVGCLEILYLCRRLYTSACLIHTPPPSTLLEGLPSTPTLSACLVGLVTGIWVCRCRSCLPFCLPDSKYLSPRCRRCGGVAAAAAVVVVGGDAATIVVVAIVMGCCCCCCCCGCCRCCCCCCCRCCSRHGSQKAM